MGEVIDAFKATSRFKVAFALPVASISTGELVKTSLSNCEGVAASAGGLQGGDGVGEKGGATC